MTVSGVKVAIHLSPDYVSTKMLQFITKLLYDADSILRGSFGFGLYVACLVRMQDDMP